MNTTVKRLFKIFSTTPAGAGFVVLGCVVGLMAAGLVTAQSPEKTTFLVIYRPGPGWLQGKPASEQPLREHGRYMLSLYEKGFIKFAGPFTDDKGGALVLEVASESEAQALVAEDPAVKSSVFIQEIHPWQLVPWEMYVKKK